MTSSKLTSIQNCSLAVEDTIHDVLEKMQDKKSIYFFDSSNRIMTFALCNEPNVYRREELHELHVEIVTKLEQKDLNQINSENYDILTEKHNYEFVYWIYKKMRLLYLCNLLNALFFRQHFQAVRTRLLPYDFVNISKLYDWEYENCIVQQVNAKSFFSNIKQTFIDTFIAIGHVEVLKNDRVKLYDYISLKPSSYTLFTDGINTKLKYIQALLVLPNNSKGFIKVSKKNESLFQKKSSDIKDINTHLKTFRIQNPVFRINDRNSNWLKHLVEKAKTLRTNIFPPKVKSKKGKKEKSAPALKNKQVSPLTIKPKKVTKKSIKKAIKKKNKKSKLEIKRLAQAEDKYFFGNLQINNPNKDANGGTTSPNIISKAKNIENAKGKYHLKNFVFENVKNCIQPKPILKKRDIKVGDLPKTLLSKEVNFDDGERPIKDKEQGLDMERPFYMTTKIKYKTTPKNAKSKIKVSQRTSEFMKKLEIVMKPVETKEKVECKKSGRDKAGLKSPTGSNKSKDLRGKQGFSANSNYDFDENDYFSASIQPYLNAKGKKGSLNMNKKLMNKAKINEEKGGNFDTSFLKKKLISNMLNKNNEIHSSEIPPKKKDMPIINFSNLGFFQTKDFKSSGKKVINPNDKLFAVKNFPEMLNNSDSKYSGKTKRNPLQKSSQKNILKRLAGSSSNEDENMLNSVLCKYKNLSIQNPQRLPPLKLPKVINSLTRSKNEAKKQANLLDNTAKSLRLVENTYSDNTITTAPFPNKLNNNKLNQSINLSKEVHLNNPRLKNCKDSLIQISAIKQHVPENKKNINAKKSSNKLQNKKRNHVRKIGKMKNDPKNIKMVRHSISRRKTKDVKPNMKHKKLGLKYKQKTRSLKRNAINHEKNSNLTKLRSLKGQETNQKEECSVASKSPQKKRNQSITERKYIIRKLKTLPNASKSRTSILFTKNGTKVNKAAKKEKYMNLLNELESFNANNIQKLCEKGEIIVQPGDLMKYGFTRFKNPLSLRGAPSFNNSIASRDRIMNWIKGELTPLIKSNHLESNMPLLDFITSKINKDLDQSYERSTDNQVKAIEIKEIMHNIKILIGCLPKKEM